MQKTRAYKRDADAKDSNETSAQPTDVQEWFQDFEPSSVTVETDLASFDELSPIPPGFRLVQVWWD